MSKCRCVKESDDLLNTRSKKHIFDVPSLFQVESATLSFCIRAVISCFEFLFFYKVYVPDSLSHNGTEAHDKDELFLKSISNSGKNK